MHSNAHIFICVEYPTSKFESYSSTRQLPLGAADAVRHSVIIPLLDVRPSVVFFFPCSLSFFFACRQFVLRHLPFCLGGPASTGNGSASTGRGFASCVGVEGRREQWRRGLGFARHVDSRSFLSISSAVSPSCAWT